MAVTQLDNRGKFLVFESNAVRLNNDIFPAESINVSLSPSIDPLMDIDGRVTNYAPNGPLKGRVDLTFDLTGQLPTYFHATGVTEAPTLVKFNTFVIYGYLENLTYEVSPYRPIKVNAGFAFFHGIKYLETQFKDKVPASFDSSLKTYNGLRSYLAVDGKNYCFVSSFNYSLTTRRTPYTKVGFESPTRVALEDVRIEINAQGSNINNYMTIRGNDTYLKGNLNELYNSDNTIIMPLAGKVVEQSFSASQGSVGQGSFKAIQSLSNIRRNVSIPFIENQLILTATPDRVFELPDFDSTCPPEIIDEQPVDGGDPGRGWTPPGGDYDPCWREGNCEPGEGGDYDGGLPGGEGGSDGAGGGPPVGEETDSTPIDERRYVWTNIYVKNTISELLTRTDGTPTYSDQTIADYNQGFKKAPEIFSGPDPTEEGINVAAANHAAPIVTNISSLKTGLNKNVGAAGLAGTLGVLRGLSVGDFSSKLLPLMNDCGEDLPNNTPPLFACAGDNSQIGGENINKFLIHDGKYVSYTVIESSALTDYETTIASISLSFKQINDAITQGKFADTIQEAEADRGSYRIELSWENQADCVYAPGSANNCPA
jgi:hypothetical protein